MKFFTWKLFRNFCDCFIVLFLWSKVLPGGEEISTEMTVVRMK